MGKRLIERRLRKVGSQLRSMRDELRVIDEQLAHLQDEADDLGVRALVADNPGAGIEYREAQAHSEAMAAHKAHIEARIAELEVSQDQLLDELTAR